MQLNHAEEAEDAQNRIFLTLSHGITQPSSSSLFSCCKSSAWCPRRRRCRDSSICHQLVLEEDLHETRNVSVPGGETGLKIPSGISRAAFRMQVVALRGRCPLMSSHLTWAGELEISLTQKCCVRTSSHLSESSGEERGKAGIFLAT